MKFFKNLDKLKKNDASVILYCLLDRIPIFVFGDNSDKIDNFLINLSDLIHFRKEYVFYTDFISNSEYNNLILNENIDINSQRVHVRCPCNISTKGISQIENINSWLIGMKIPQKREHFSDLRKTIKKKTNKYLFIIFSAGDVSIELEGIDFKSGDLILEQNIFKKISQDTEKSIIKMKRVLNDKIKLSNLDKDLIKTLVDFEIEKTELKKNIFKREIQNFYSGSKRAFFILSRLSLLNNIEIHAKIGSKTLLETIDYEDAPIERIISFITKEWSENFSDLIEDGKKAFIGDKIVSLWG